MKMFNFASILSCGLSVLLLVATNSSAIPLTRISDSLINTGENKPGWMPSDQKNLGPLSPEKLLEISTPAIASGVQNSRPADDARAQVLARVVRGPVVSRSRRQAEESSRCVVSADSPVVEANNLNTLLNATTFLGLNPNQPEEPTLPANQPDSCDVNSSQWWSQRTEENLRSVCPWRWEITSIPNENGAEIYPKKIRQARCLCGSCITDTAFSCVEMRQAIPVFQKIGCRGGLAVMLQVPKNITVGCYCQGPIPNNRTTLSTPDITTTPNLPAVDD